ncbi:MAG: ATP-binding protein [Prevotella sp.]|nr:ATP-binding protein [Prevotella sp.]
MLKRKIETVLEEWKQTPDHKPLVLKGCRQCGKTFSVEKFAHENYAHVVSLNFVHQPDLAFAFQNSKVVDDIIVNITAMVNGATFEPGNTCLILDEIQECPEARTALKFFKLDGRFDVIATGSLLGVKGYGQRRKNGEEFRKTSVPVGYETIIEMYPLDFEEYLWANGIPDLVIQRLKQHFVEKTPIEEAIHQRMRQLLLQYTVVGGMPEAVNTFIETHDMGRVLNVQRTIIDEYKDDMMKYANDEDKPHIRECFESIPRQLSKENKKFQYSVIRKGGKAAQYKGSLQWIEDAGIIQRCRNLSITELPLDGNAIDEVFKVYMADTGLLIAMLEEGTQLDVLQGNLLGYKGAIFENLIADIFGKMRRKLYYFRKESGLEIDFVIRYQGHCTLVEAKSTTGNVKSTKTILSHPEKYHVYHAIKLGDYNIGYSGNMLTLPHYMAFFLTER